MDDAGLRPGVYNGRKVSGNIIQQIGRSQRAKSAAQTVSRNQNGLATCGVCLNQVPHIIAHGIIDKLKSLVHRAASRNWSIRRGNKVDIVQPVLEKFRAAKSHNQPSISSVNAHPSKMEVGWGRS